MRSKAGIASTLVRDDACLAVLGGEPRFSEPLHVGRPWAPDRDRLMARINDLLDRRWFSNAGPLVREFESRIAAFTGVRHCVATCNGTVALELATRALDLKGEVIVPSFTFIATAHALAWQGITPVFCDIDPATHCLDVSEAERLITPRTSGILGVHLWGRACDVEGLARIARRRAIPLLFDASHAFSCTRGGRPLARFGECQVFSFHATKFLNTFEGGAIVTDDGALAARLRFMKNFGFAGYDDVQYIGTNGKMTEICAAMGLTGLESIEAAIAWNRRNYELYRDRLAGLPGVTLLRYDESERNNYQYIVLEIDAAAAGLPRDVLLEVLHRERVLARRYFYPGCHRMEPYRSLFPNAPFWLPRTEELSERVLVLPTGQSIGEKEIEAIVAIIRAALDNAADVREAVERSGGRLS